MFGLYVRFVIAVSLMQFGIHLSECDAGAKQCSGGRIERAALKLLRVEWRPISIFKK